MPEAFPERNAQPDLSSCEREQIQFLGAVQSFAALLVVSEDWVIRHASSNIVEVFSATPADLVGDELAERLPPGPIHKLRGKIQTLGRKDEGVRVFGLDLLEDGHRFDVAIHRLGAAYMLEFERKERAGERDDLALVQPLMGRVRRAGTIEQMCEVATRGILTMTGFGRVMAYRFAPDSSGTVIAESRDSGMEGYLELHFPPSDIPAQARALYRRNLLRIIPDVDAPVSPVEPAVDAEGAPVDLSLSVSRAVSPIHLEYLRNMKVRASMSVSILRDGELWGMIACHHSEPLYVDYEMRSAVELFAQMLAYELHLREDAIETQRAEAAHDLHDRLVTRFEAGAAFTGGLDAIAREIREVIDIDGFALMADDRYCVEGCAPTEEEFHALQEQIARGDHGRLVFTDHLEGLAPGAVAPERGIAGVIALPLRHDPRQYAMLFRREVAQNVSWAGNPSKMAAHDGRVSPRKSFAAWQEIVRGKSAPWGTGDRRAAEVLRVALLELVLKQASEVNVHGRQRSQRQEVVISELNHRLRNVFSLVGGLVARSGTADPAAAELAARIEGRIRALAKANDQLTATAHGSFALTELIRDEAEAFAGETGRLIYEGGDVRLPASLRGTLALVIHELVTNSVKYGALGSSGGSVRVGLSPAEDGGAIWAWEERGGPPVHPPERVGFGTTLITQSIPHELGGEARLDYAEDGLRARFRLPPLCVEAILPHISGEPSAGAGPAGAPQLSGPALVVEDNLVIAMNAAEALRALGAEDVWIAGSIGEALSHVGGESFTIAILDLDLGGQTSAPVAAELKRRGVPFLLATGYDAPPGGETAFEGVPILAKPYSNDAIAATLRRI